MAKRKITNSLLLYFFFLINACSNRDDLIKIALESSPEQIKENASNGGAIDKYIYSIALKYGLNGIEKNEYLANLMRMQALTERTNSKNYVDGRIVESNSPELQPYFVLMVENCIAYIISKADFDKAYRSCGGKKNFQYLSEKWNKAMMGEGKTNSYETTYNASTYTEDGFIQDNSAYTGMSRNKTIIEFYKNTIIHGNAHNLKKDAENALGVKYNFSRIEKDKDTQNEVEIFDGGKVGETIYSTSFIKHYIGGINGKPDFVVIDFWSKEEYNQICFEPVELFKYLKDNGFSNSGSFQSGEKDFLRARKDKVGVTITSTINPKLSVFEDKTDASYPSQYCASYIDVVLLF